MARPGILAWDTNRKRQYKAVTVHGPRESAEATLTQLQNFAAVHRIRSKSQNGKGGEH
jgi:hypothetical protein